MDIRKARDIGRGVGLLHYPEGLDPFIEARERPALVAALPRRDPHAQRDLGDHAQHPLGAHEQLPQRGPSGRGGLGAGADLAGRRQAAKALHELVDPPVAGGRLSGGPRRHPAADGRELERLREVAERQTVRGQLRLRLGPEQPGLERGGQRRAVDVSDPVEAAQVQRDGGREAVSERLHPADDARAAAEGHERHLLLRAGGQHGAQRVGRGWAGHRVGGARGVARAHAHEVGITAADRVAHPRCAVEAQPVAKHGDQALARSPRQRRLRQAHLLQPHALIAVRGSHSELIPEQVRGGRGQLDRVTVLAPAPPAHAQASPQRSASPERAPSA